MSLFLWGDFLLSSGQRSPLKINCDALGSGDWQALADLALCYLPPFGQVEGVPTGGMLLASFLSHYSQGPNFRPLIVDDVWTTGRQITEQRGDREAYGLVVFARTEPAEWVVPLFKLYQNV